MNDITSKGNEALSFLKRNLKTSNQQIKTQAYQALVMHYPPHTSESIRKNEMAQRRAARYICNIYHNTSSVSDMLNIINLPSLAERRLRAR
jgi:transposase-like protein